MGPYIEGRMFVGKRLQKVRTQEDVDLLVRNAYDSKWARFYNWSLCRSSRAERIQILVGGIVATLLILTLIAGCIWSCCKRARKRKAKDSVENEHVDGENDPVEIKIDEENDPVEVKTN